MFNLNYYFMKRLFLCVLAIFCTFGAKSQIITTQDVEDQIAKLYGTQPQTGKEYRELADKIIIEYPLDANNQISFTTVLEIPGKQKDELFIMLNNWFVSSFNSGKSVIQMVDKEQGVILAKGYLSGVGSRMGFMKSVVVGEYIIIRIVIKYEKIRIITSIQEYYMDTSVGVGQILFGGVALQDITLPVYSCYPFDKKQHKSYKNEAAIGYVGGIVYSKVLVDKIEKATKFGITGTESQNW